MCKKIYQGIWYKYKLLASLILVFLVPCIVISLILMPKIRGMERGNCIESLMLVFLLGCAGILLIWRRNYKPVQEILVKLQDSAPAYKKELLISLIKGEYGSIDEFHEKAAEAGIYLKGSRLFMMAVSVSETDGPGNAHKTALLEQLLAQSEKRMPEAVLCYGFVDTMNEKIIFISGTELSGKKELEDSLERFKRQLQEEAGFELNIGCSQLYEDISGLGSAYMEALTALDYRIVYGSGKMIFFSGISLSNYSHNWYPEEQTRKFRVALKTGDEEHVHKILDEIIEELHHNHTPVYVAKYVCYDLMQILADSLVMTKALPYKKTIGYHNIMNIARVSSFEQIAEILHQNVKDVLAMNVEEEREQVNQEMKHRLEQYIEDNYSDCSFSMVSLAEEFEVSESTMRRNFKLVMQTTFMEYLAEKRISRSKELLAGTELPMNRIAGEVGYQDTSSFIRRFRQKTGMPPGEYRILYRKKKLA